MRLLARIQARIDVRKTLQDQYGLTRRDAVSAASMVTDDVVDDAVESLPPDAVKALGDGALVEKFREWWAAHRDEIVSFIVSLILGSLMLGKAGTKAAQPPKPAEHK